MKKPVKYLVISLALVSILLGLGCSFLPGIGISTGTPTTSPPSTLITQGNPGWTLPPPQEQPVLPDFVSVMAKIRPSVVAINVVVYDIFNQPQEAAGSGWIIDSQGYVVTNNHVVDGAQSITVNLENGQTFPARIVGTDPLSDIAVIKVDNQNLVKANVGDSTKLNVGEWVLAIGNSLNLGVTPSEGIVRSVGTSVPVSEGQTLSGLIGTSAAINPGNSGGPLVNMRAEVVGITTVKIAAVGVEAMGWAISTEVAIPIIQDLIKNGYVIRPYLGVTAQSVNQWLVLRYDLGVNKGAFLTQVASGSPAAKAGLQPGDVIVRFAGRDINTADELVQAIHNGQIGQDVEIVFWREKNQSTTRATLAESPPP